MINRRPAVTSMRMTADDVWAVVLVLPILSLAFGLVAFGTTLFKSPVHFLKGYFPTLTLVTVFHVALVQISYAMRRRFPSHPETTKRLLAALALYLITSFFAIHFSLWIFDAIGLLGLEKTPELTRRCFFVALVGNLVNGIMYDLFYTFAKTKEALVAKEGLQKEHLRQQFDALKTQVNPHFLFNNLTTLAELIEEDTDAADRFLNQMSKVYRYMLRSRNHSWATIQQELQCLDSYFYLHTVRYGSMLSFEKNIEVGSLDWQIPSLSLSLIAEEAIRTSRFSKTEPLLIQLASAEGTLVLTYSHRPKTRLMEPEGLNWTFLSDRYAEEGVTGFACSRANGAITVTLPLLQTAETFTAV
ncbi:MAG: histidine kinase [Bacteroidota bacterium]|nr:histidine kinase [Bacteroidota bacterium]